jgi:hypothetical protein
MPACRQAGSLILMIIFSDITYLSELIPTSAAKLWNRILPHLTSRDRNNDYPLLKLAKILCDNFSQSFGVNSQTSATKLGGL